MAAWRGLGEGEGELAAGGVVGDGCVRHGEHGDAILVGVGDVTDVDLGRAEGDDVAGRGAVLPGEVAEGLNEGSREVVLAGEGGSLDRDRTAGAAIRDQDFLGSTDELAVDRGVAQVQGNGLQSGGVGEQLEAAGAAVLEDDRGLLSVGGGSGGGVSDDGVVDAGEGEVNRGDLTHGAVQRPGATSTGDFVQDAIHCVVDGDAAGGAAAVRFVGDARRGHNRFGHGAGLEGGAESRRGAEGTAAAGELNAEGALHSGVGEQLLRCTEVRAHQVAAHHVALLGDDVEVADQHGVAPGGGGIGAVSRLKLDEDETFAEKLGHLPYLLGVGERAAKLRARSR